MTALAIIRHFYYHDSAMVRVNHHGSPAAGGEQHPPGQSDESAYLPPRQAVPVGWLVACFHAGVNNGLW